MRAYRFLLCGVVAFSLVAGCASFDGSSLVPGKSTAAEVEGLMGTPAERTANPDGSSVWFYVRAPIGRQTYAVTIGADGVMRSIEQRRTLANVEKLKRGETTTRQVRDLFGPPDRVVRAARRPVDVWEYRMLDGVEKRVLWIEFSDDGRIEKVMEMHDSEFDPPSGPGAMP